MKVVRLCDLLSPAPVLKGALADQLDRMGIKREPPRQPSHTVSSTGFSEKDQKWYGWSHRAIAGFGVGDEVKDHDILSSLSDVGGKYEPGYKPKSLAECKAMAEAFADAVS